MSRSGRAPPPYAGAVPPPPPPDDAWARVAGRCTAITRSRAFEVLIVVLIGANAIVLGIETYPHLGPAL